MDSAKRPSSSEILNRLLFSDGIEASDAATASSYLSTLEDRQPDLLPSTGSPTDGNSKKKRKERPGPEERLEKRTRGKEAAAETAILQA
ncbi:hypothetical protein FRC04_005798 [Tulasnella sp. 424]|nr:hypothetical protein FRC04_005798 [Tulasnella sp. 424]